MRTILFVSVSLLLFQPLWAQPAEERPAPKELEAQLAATTGPARLDLLLELTEAYRQDDPAKAISNGREALELLAATPDEDRELALLNALGEAQFRLRDYKTGLRHAAEAEHLARTAGNKPELARALWQIGRISWRSDELQRALEALTEAIDLYEELGDTKGQAHALMTAGAAAGDGGDSQQALAFCFRAYGLFEEAGNLRGVGSALNDIGIEYYILGQSDKALDFHHRGLEIHQQLGDREKAGRSLHNIGNVYHQTGDWARALEVHFQALEIRERVGVRRSIARTLYAIGNDYRDLGEPEQATTYYQRSIRIWEEIGNKRGAATTLEAIGELHRQLGSYQAAREVLERAVALMTEVGVPPSSVLQKLVEVYGALGLSREMLEAFQQYDAITKESYDEENSRAIAEMQARFEADQKEKEIELLRQEQALQALDLERQRTIRWALVGGFGLVLLILFLVFNRFRLKAREALMVETVRQEREISARLKELDKLKDEFLANTSHELRTPLYGITGLAESLIDGAAGKVPEAVKSNLSMIVQSGHRLTHLVGDILDFSKLRRKSLELDTRPVDLRPLVEVVLTLSRPLLGSKELVLENSVPTDLPAALADEDRLQQILHNLIGNAIKFTRSGSVEISAAVTGEGIVVRVTDTGIGIPAENQERIFDAFEQAHASSKREYGGTGLGLAVTRQLVKLHGGEIHLESNPGEGSVFSFTLPVAEGAPETARPRIAALRPAVEPAPVLVAHETPETEPAVSEAPAPRMGDILIVDDEPVIRQVLVNQLVTSGYRLRQATSGADALALIEQRPPDLILLDVMMPRMSGYEVCRTLRQRHALDELPVIFLTAKNQAPDLVVGLTAGANDYLPKPISKSELLARVKTHLALLHVHRQLSSLVDERTSQLREREQLLIERESLIGQLESRNAELTHFNYTIAHDLKNPLTTIKNFIGLVTQDAEAGDHERLHQDLQQVDKAADRLQLLLEDLHHFSCVERNSGPGVEVPFGELVREALSELADIITDRRVDVVIKPELPVVRGNRERLREVARHLLTNAVRYLGDQPSPRVEIGIRETEPGAVVTVRDNGIGIDPQFQEKVFGLFERLDPEGSDGTGVGLALVKRIIEAEGGKVWVESEGLGKGSTFCLSLPVA